ncbi:MAG: hypothetical protein MK000_04595 [Anaerolineales bacterium]|nr:hypothetical protein [Anaerolineales bacterium]
MRKLIYPQRYTANALLDPAGPHAAGLEVHHERASEHKRTIREEQLEHAMLADPLRTGV